MAGLACTLMLSLLPLCLCGVEPPTDPDPDEAPAVTIERATQLVRAMNATSVTRGFRLRVVDQLGRPIAGIPIIGSTMTMSATYDGSDSPTNVVDASYLSDVAGDVVIPRKKVYDFKAFVDRKRMPPAVAIPDDSQAGFYFSVTDIRPPGADEKRLGVDAILRLYRYDGPHPLLAMHAPETGGFSADGTPFPWSPLMQRSRVQTGADFEVTVARDPTAPLVVRGRRFPETPERDLPNFQATWTLQLRCLRGGIAPVAAQEVGFTAPEDGYRASYVWDSPVQDAIKNLRHIRFFWRRTGTPVRYIFIELTCHLDIQDVKTAPSVATSIESWAYVNPAAGDRLLERPFQQRYDPRSRDTPPWLTELSPTEVEQWNLEPVDGGAIPLTP